MSFGYVIPNLGNLAQPDILLPLAIRAEELRFDHLWFGDHIIIPNEILSAYPYTEGNVSPFIPKSPQCEPLATLAYIAGRTQRIKVGPFVLIVPYREPIFTAKILSTLDYMSGGRLIVGVGVGWMEEEFKALGLNTFSERAKVTDEYIKIYKELWTKDDPVFEGKYAQLSGFKFYPKPIQKPHPPIWVGGNTNAALRRAATLGDCWLPLGIQPNTQLEPPEMARTIARLRDMTERAGRPREAVDVALVASVVFDPPTGGQRRTMTGTPDQIAADIVRFREVGVKHFVTPFGGNQDDPNWVRRFGGEGLDGILGNMERFAREVMPLVRY